MNKIKGIENRKQHEAVNNITIFTILEITRYLKLKRTPFLLISNNLTENITTHLKIKCHYWKN